MAIAAISTMSQDENNNNNNNKTGRTEKEEEEEDEHEHDMVMPGFRFHPTEEELIEFYLRRKVEGKRFNVELITFLDLYRYDPWELPGTIYSIYSNKSLIFFVTFFFFFFFVIFLNNLCSFGGNWGERMVFLCAERQEV